MPIYLSHFDTVSTVVAWCSHLFQHLVDDNFERAHGDLVLLVFQPLRFLLLLLVLLLLVVVVVAVDSGCLPRVCTT